MESNIKASVHVRDLRLRVKKGLYPAEKFLSNEFLVNADVQYDPSLLGPGAFLDYTELASIISEVMHSDEHLLEKCASAILEKIVSHWQSVVAVSIRIDKLQPPFVNCQAAAVGVSLQWQL